MTKILVIDDAEQVRSQIKKLLTYEGYEIIRKFGLRQKAYKKLSCNSSTELIIKSELKKGTTVTVAFRQSNGSW